MLPQKYWSGFQRIGGSGLVAAPKEGPATALCKTGVLLLLDQFADSSFGIVGYFQDISAGWIPVNTGHYRPKRPQGLDGLEVLSSFTPKQTGEINIEGTIGDIRFYKMEGEGYVRCKSSLEGKRVKRAKVFARTKCSIQKWPLAFKKRNECRNG